MGGGPSQQQKDAAAAQAAQTNQLTQEGAQQYQFGQQQQAKVNPFYTNQMNNGLPYMANMTDAMSGNTAQAFAPARAQLEAQLGQNPNALPSGFAQQARTDLASNQGRAFDQQLQGAQAQNFQAKQQGAAGLMGQQSLANPTGYSGQAIQGNQSIMQAPLASPGIGGLLGGMMSAVPF